MAYPPRSHPENQAVASTQIEIDGRKEIVWRHLKRQKPSGFDVTYHYGQPGMHGGRFSPRRLGPSGIILKAGTQRPGLEVWTESEKLEVWLAEAINVEDIAQINTASKSISTRAGKSISAEITKKPLSEEEYKIIQQERLISVMAERNDPQKSAVDVHSKPALCAVCGWLHDARFTQIIIPGKEPITLRGILPDIVGHVHKEHEKGLPKLSSKDDVLLRLCGGYGNVCKAFYDLKQQAAYEALFDTSRRGFISLRDSNRKKS